ncbi:MAG: hypothetical protein PHU23_17840, partial [Dehalococcoidales bacterium]|nr:hypothetical protein [Dehalococcoidales bacterium]
VIQRNAILSWKLLGPDCEIILFGSEKGTAEIAAELGIRHIPEVERNEYGTPLVNSLFNKAQKIASHDILCYVNADIILTQDFLTSVQRASNQKDQFLLIGQRWDVELNKLLDFTNQRWELEIRGYLAKYGKLHPATGIDYFVFRKGLWGDIPPFAIGRTVWDIWLVYRGLYLKVPVIDATKTITAIHQNHDYSHNDRGIIGIWEGPEAQQNRQYYKGYAGNRFFAIRDATWVLTSKGVERASPVKVLYYRTIATSKPYILAPTRLLRKVHKLIKDKGSKT